MDQLIIMKDQQAVTSSLQVAETFNKNHRDVLRAVDDLKEGVAQNWADLFYEDTYTHPQNKQQYRIIYMNRDGFTLLAMGFTGKKAMKFKLKYIEAFNKMESHIKTGGFKVPSTMAEALRLAADQQEQIETMKPKVNYFDQIMASKSLMITTTIAKDYGMSAKAFNDLLKKLKIQYKLGGIWYLHSKYQDKGWVSSSTRMIDGNPRTLTKWTQKGRVGLYNLLKAHDIVPMIEKLDITTVTIGGQQ
ncbi:phage regulatory protein/antirepressor Ant [Companilactobacillus nodensis]|uniref:Phage-related antirepressor n=1 Tax=Companilactobacillus nodensis DSM 19682 = JCM 14932 = NBRC 107160 TaxID=1423775 RepID=A0A0R1K997_9LACO|nr:phage regulatory protein/antirepressor Ant [Companilactobacillus nodensis]KRK80262.1 phage-related antirepressor [Companilactobacillus nodensis DSM 19682 = JCM 14932 = NBRC 107160]